MSESQEILMASIKKIRSCPMVTTLHQNVELHIESGSIVKLHVEETGERSSSFAILNEILLTLSLPNSVVPRAVADWLEQPEIFSLLEQTINGMGERFDGRNMIGTLTQASRDSYNKLIDDSQERWYGMYPERGDILTYWEPAEWFDASKDEFIHLKTLDELKEYIKYESNEGIPQTDQEGEWILLDEEDSYAYARELWFAVRIAQREEMFRLKAQE